MCMCVSADSTPYAGMTASRIHTVTSNSEYFTRLYLHRKENGCLTTSMCLIRSSCIIIVPNKGLGACRVMLIMPVIILGILGKSIMPK